MPQRSPSPASFSIRALVVAAFAGFALAPACSGRATHGVRQNSQTHWLERCDTSAQCGTLECSCGICTQACAATNACSSLGASAVCAALTASNVCADAVLGSVCLAGCQGNEDCEGETTCREGACVPMARTTGSAEGERRCDTNDDCPSGICEGEGCGAGQGTCRPTSENIPCTDDVVTYCTCDGVTIGSSGSCPGVRYEYRGECGDPASSPPDVESCPSETCASVALPNGDTVIVPAEHAFERQQGFDSLVGTLRDEAGNTVFLFDGCGLWTPDVPEGTGEAGEARNTTFRVLFPEIAGGPTYVSFADRMANIRIEGIVPQAEALRIAQSYSAIGAPCSEE